MSDAVDNVRRRLLSAASALQAAHVPYAVVGDIAVAAWVSRADEAAVRNTRDVDLPLHARICPPPLPGWKKPGSSTAAPAKVVLWGRPGRWTSFWRVRQAKCAMPSTSFLPPRKTRPDQPEPNAAVEEIEDTGAFHLIPLEALVRMKLSAFRDKDRVHLRDLASVGLLDESSLARLSSALVQRLQEILDSPDE